MFKLKLFSLLLLALYSAAPVAAQTVRSTYDGPIPLDALVPITGANASQLVKLGEMRFYNDNGEPVRLAGYSSSEFDFSADGSHLIVTVDDSLLSLVVETGVGDETFGDAHSILWGNNIFYSHSERYLALWSFGSYAVSIFDIANPTDEGTLFIHEFDGAQSIIGWNADDTLLYVSSEGNAGDVIRVWDMATKTEVDRFYNPCQRHFMILNQAGTIYYCIDTRTLNAYDLQTDELLSSTDIQMGAEGYSIEFTPDDRFALVGSIHFYTAVDLEAGEQYAAFVSPFGRDGIRRYSDGSLGIWTDMAISPDGSLAVTNDTDAAVMKFRDLQTNLPLFTMPAQGEIQDFRFNPDGTLLAVYDQTGRIYLYGIPTCAVSAANDVNLRGGPATFYDAVAVLPAERLRYADGQAVDAEGFTWWRLSGGAWVRDDIVTEAGVACADLPIVTI